jgi:hypothetical protein
MFIMLFVQMPQATEPRTLTVHCLLGFRQVHMVGGTFQHSIVYDGFKGVFFLCDGDGTAVIVENADRKPYWEGTRNKTRVKKNQRRAKKFFAEHLEVRKITSVYLLTKRVSA